MIKLPSSYFIINQLSPVKTPIFSKVNDISVLRFLDLFFLLKLLQNANMFSPGQWPSISVVTIKQINKLTMSLLSPDVGNILKIGGGIIALGTLVKAVYEFVQQRKDKRAAQFLALRESFREDPVFRSIQDQLEEGNDFSQLRPKDRFEFMAFFEDIGFLMNSGLIRKEVAFYMFGYEAIRAWNNDAFWNEEFRTDMYWSLLADFIGQMKEVEKTFQYKRRKMRL